MSAYDLLRYVVAYGTAPVTGAVVVVFVIYLVGTVRAPRTGRLLLRHVAEVSLAVALFVAAVGVGVWDTIGTPNGPPVSRLLMYLAGEVLLGAAMLDVGQHLRALNFRRAGGAP